MSMTPLQERLAEDPGGVYLLLGDALPLVEGALEQIRARMESCLGPPGLNRSSHRATDGDLSSSLVAARTLPMLGTHRLVVVLEAEQASPEFWSSVLEYAQEPSPSTVLVMVATKLPKTKKGQPNVGVRLKNALKKQNSVFPFQSKDADPRAFARSVAKAQGKQMDRHAAAVLVELVGPDLGVLAQEVGKICLYVGEAEAIETADVEGCVAALADAEVWDLTTGLALRDSDLALAALHRLSEGGDDPRRLLSMVLWQYRSLLTADAMVAQGIHDGDVRQAVRMRWEVFRAVRPWLGTGVLDAAQLLDRMAAASLAMNRYKAGAQHVLERVVLELLNPVRTKGPSRPC
jgi:DNA polymerase-3 subunit delta